MLDARALQGVGPAPRSQVTLPAYAGYGNVDGLITKDDYLLNCYPEQLPDGRTCLTTRAGYSVHNRPPGANAPPRGITSFNGHIYTVFGDVLYRGTTAIANVVQSADQITNKVFTTGWTFVNAGIDGSGRTDPFGKLEAFRLRNTSTSDSTITHSAITVPANQRVWFGVFVKDNAGHTTDDGHVLKLRAELTGGTAKTYEAKFKPTAGSIGTHEITGTAANGECLIKSAMGGGWYLCILHMTTGNNTTLTVRIVPSTGTNLSDSDTFTNDRGNIFYHPFVVFTTTGASGQAWMEETGIEDRYLAVLANNQLMLVGTDDIPWPVRGLRYQTDVKASGLAALDGMLALLTRSGYLLHSEPYEPFNWHPNAYLNAESFPDEALHLARHINYLAVFGRRSIEFYYNAKLEEGASFGRVDGAMQQIGLACPNAIASIKGVQFFLSDKHAVYQLGETKPARVSTPAIERAIGANLANPCTVYASCVEADGHVFAIFNFTSDGITLAYDATAQAWMFLQYGAGGNYRLGMASLHDGRYYAMDTSSGHVYLIGATTQDVTENIRVEARSSRVDFGIPGRKTLAGVTLVSSTGTGLMYFDHSENGSTWQTRSWTPDQRHHRETSLGQFESRYFRWRYEGTEKIQLIQAHFDIVR